MKKLLREPLVHFLALGAALFLVFHFRNASGGATAGRLVVPAGRIEALAASFASGWQRPPTKSELDGLIEEWIHEEVLYREALARGLDQDDAILRRRLRQKLEFVADDLAEAAAPTDAELAAYLKLHADSFRLEPKLAFRQIFVDRERRGASAESDAQALLKKLRGLPAGADVSELGDPLRLLTDEPGLQTLSQIEWLFGEKFAAALERLERGVWAGPIESGYGLHLVLVIAREEGRVPELAEVRDAVVREWTTARRKELADAFYRGLRARYDVVIEWPER